MPRIDGVSATLRIKPRWPDIQILVLTTFDDNELVFRAAAPPVALSPSPLRPPGAHVVPRWRARCPPRCPPYGKPTWQSDVPSMRATLTCKANSWLSIGHLRRACSSRQGALVAVERPCPLKPLLASARKLAPCPEGVIGKYLHWHAFCEVDLGNRLVATDDRSWEVVDAVTAKRHHSANRGPGQAAGAHAFGSHPQP
ncbi:MAG: hypothetical protein M3069_04300 [Chloroflexota bacterium]|nr:hypothetical protein [Chloroflexota bacterium]